MPQYDGATPVSVEMYRDLLNEAADGINAADADATSSPPAPRRCRATPSPTGSAR